VPVPEVEVLALLVQPEILKVERCKPSEESTIYELKDRKPTKEDQSIYKMPAEIRTKKQGILRKKFNKTIKSDTPVTPRKERLCDCLIY
jgi:hypothetical protein